MRSMRHPRPTPVARSHRRGRLLWAPAARRVHLCSAPRHASRIVRGAHGARRERQKDHPGWLVPLGNPRPVPRGREWLRRERRPAGDRANGILHGSGRRYSLRPAGCAACPSTKCRSAPETNSTTSTGWRGGPRESSRSSTTRGRRRSRSPIPKPRRGGATSAGSNSMRPRDPDSHWGIR